MRTYTDNYKGKALVGFGVIVALLTSFMIVFVAPPLAIADSQGGSGGIEGGSNGGGGQDQGGTGGNLSPPPGNSGGSGPGTGGSGPGSGGSGSGGGGGQGYSYSRITYISSCPANDLGDAAVARNQTWTWTAKTEEQAYGISGGLQGVRSMIKTNSSNLSQLSPLSLRSLCLYPARWVIRQAAAYCAISTDAAITQTVPRSRTLSENTSVSSWGQGVKTIDACVNSSTKVAVNADFNEYGRYRGQVSSLMQSINIKTYTSPNELTGVTPPDEIASVGAPYRVYPGERQWQLTCAGFSNGWSGNPAFNQTECGPDQTRNPQKYQCTIDGDKNPLVNGTHTNNATVFRDGELNTIAWSRPSITGTANGVPEGKTQILRSGTPWNTTSQFPTAKTNDVELYRDGKSKFTAVGGTGWMNKIMPDGWGLKAYWASDTGKPTLLTPQYKWMAQWVIETQKVVSMDGATGAAELAPSSTTVTAEALCTGTPLTVNIVRATTGTG
jgi:hypothetical protein